MKTLITNGTIITATDTYTADVLVDGETIAMIGKNLPVKADRTIDATERILSGNGNVGRVEEAMCERQLHLDPTSEAHRELP